MEDSPRSSKRRKLNETPEKPRSTVPNGTLKRPLRQSLRRRAEDGTSKGVTSSPVPSNSRSSHNGSIGSVRRGRKSKAADGVDVYDDIDGALESRSSSLRPRKRNGSSGNATGRVEGAEAEPQPAGKRRQRRSKVSEQEIGNSEDERNGVEIPMPSTPSKSKGIVPSSFATSSDHPKSGSARAGRKPRVWPKHFTKDYTEDAPSPQQESGVDTTATPKATQTPAHSTSIQKQKAKVLVKGGVDHEDERSLLGTRPVHLQAQPVHGNVHAADSSNYDQLRTIVLEKLTRRLDIPLIGLDDEYKKVYQVAEQTVTAGEGNSMLLIGARGSGKTALIEKVMKELAKDSMTEFHVIRLNAFVHTDDKLALREIWRQLGREMEAEDDGTSKSYADTLAKLLALLSNPSELSGGETDHVAKAVIFIMDEFDLFATHARQTLLYNLFDTAQSRKAPIAVFGLTTRIDVAESLEKRVKSRFSHRYVHLSLAKNLSMFQNICKAGLSVQPDELSMEERIELAPPAPSEKPSKARKMKEDALGSWNSSIDTLFNESDFLARYITPHFHLSKSVSAAFTSLQLPLALMESKILPPKVSQFYPTGNEAGNSVPQLIPPDSSLHLIPTLSALSLALLIAAARCTIIHDTDALNFRVAYAEYSSLASKARIQSASSGALAVGAGTGTRVWSREAARAGWEELVRLGFLIPALSGECDGREVGEKGMVRVDVALEEIAPSCPRLERVMERWCKQI